MAAVGRVGSVSMFGTLRWLWTHAGGLCRVLGRDCQEETAKGGGFVSSIAAGRREVLSRHHGAAGLDVTFVPGELCPSLPVCPIPGEFGRA